MEYEYGDINFTDDPDYDHDLRSFESDQDSDDSEKLSNINSLFDESS